MKITPTIQILTKQYLLFNQTKMSKLPWKVENYNIEDLKLAIVVPNRIIKVYSPMGSDGQTDLHNYHINYSGTLEAV